MSQVSWMMFSRLMPGHSAMGLRRAIPQDSFLVDYWRWQEKRVLEPGRKSVNNQEGKIQCDTDFVCWRVSNLVHFHKSLHCGGAMVELEEALSSRAFPSPLRMGMDDTLAVVHSSSSPSVVGILNRVRGGYDSGTYILVAVTVQVSMQAAIVVYPGGELGARETRGVELVRVRFAVLLGEGIVDRQHVCLGGETHCDACHCFYWNKGRFLLLSESL